MTGQTRSTSPSVGLLTDQPLPDLLTVLGHLWSNSLMAGYPSAASDDVARRDLCPQCIEIETVPHLYRCEGSTMAKSVPDSPPRTPY
jgi:hypothetical protein